MNNLKMGVKVLQDKKRIIIYVRKIFKYNKKVWK